MTETITNFDHFLESHENRSSFMAYLKTLSADVAVDNLMTLYLLISCLTNPKNKNHDANKMKQISERTYKSCILKHEAEIEHIFGKDVSTKLSHSLKTGSYEQGLLNHVTNSIRKMLEAHYLPPYLNSLKQNARKLRSTSSSVNSVSSGLGSKSGSSLSLNQIPNPYNVVTKPVKPRKNLETQSMFETRKSSKKSANQSMRKSKALKPATPKAEQNPTEFFSTLSSKLQKINLNERCDEQPEANSSHVSRVKTNRANQTVVHSTPVASSANEVSSAKTTVAYYLPGESLAYLCSFNGNALTLAQFKQLITKRGHFRYFFKTKTHLLDDECVVFQEESDDSAILPMFNDKIIAKIEYK